MRTPRIPVHYDAERDRVVVGYRLLTRDEAQALAERLTDAVDDAERVEDGR